jgi:hypothetical protein
MPYLTWVFGRLEIATKTLRRYTKLHSIPSVSLKNAKNQHRFSIRRYKNKYDTREMITAFASIFTHSVESNALYYFFDLGKLLKLLFEAANLPSIYLYSNHDSVGISPMYNFLLKPLFAHCYTRLSKANLLRAQNIIQRALRPYNCI